jgi:hypothetical protein
MLGEVPDEFLCQIMATLMTDPVKLPGCDVVCDKKNIMQHLLNSSINPYTNLPMTIDQCSALPELKEKIQNWRKGGSK